MKWGLVAKPDLGPYLKDVKGLYDYLKSRRQRVEVESLLSKTLRTRGVPIEKMRADVVLAVGGDGTVLYTLLRTGRPVLCVNAGGVGFLSETEARFAKSAVDRVLGGRYRVEERAKIACYLDKQRLPDAANEITVQSSKIAKLIKFQIAIDDEVVDTMRGDGVIVSTATGSTGYSLSVGGPILHPSVEAFVVSPIAPFRLGARPLVVPARSAIRVTVLERRSVKDKPAKVVVDGQTAFDVPMNSVVRVKASEARARLVRFDGGFYERVRTKLR